MRTSQTTSSSLGSFLEESSTSQANRRPASQETSFQQYMEESIDSGGSAATQAPSSPGEAPVIVAQPILEPDPVQNGIPGAIPVIAAPSTVVAPQTPAQTPPSAASGAVASPMMAEDASIAAVRNALAAEGLDPNSVQLTTWQEEVWYPGGGYTNQFLRATGPDGRFTDFSARLSERTPHVTVCDIRHMLNGTGGWGNLLS